MNRKHLLPIITGLTFAAIILLVSAMDNAQAEDARLHLNFKEDLSLVPETNPREGGPYPSILVQAQYTDLGIDRVNKQRVPIETWTSDDRDANMTITFETLNFFYSIVQEGYEADPEINVLMRLDGQQFYDEVYSFQDPNDDEMREEIIDLTEIQSSIGRGVTLEIELLYSGYEDLVFGYDHRIRDSGITTMTDFLYTWNMSAKDRDVVLELADIHPTDWEAVGNFINLSVDGEPRNNQSFTVNDGVSHNESGFIINSSYITWELDDPLLGGEEVEIWIKYIDADPGADLGMRKMITADQGNLRKPVAEITSIDPETSYEGDEVFFDASGSSDVDGSVVWYRWGSDLDGVLYDGDDPEFSRADLSVGMHMITLKVKDDDDLWSDGVDIGIQVEERPQNAVPSVALVAPANDGIIDLTYVTLSWEGEDGDDDEITYDVYFDENADPQTMVAGDITDESREVADLEDGFTYYWKVVVSDGEDEAESDIWSFTIELPPEPENTAPTVQLLSPANTQVVETYQFELMWSGDDEDGEELTYDVYIGLNPSELNLVAVNLTNTSYPLSGLSDGQTFFWKIMVSDGTDSTESPVYSFSMKLKKESSNSDDDFEIAGINGFVVIALIAVFVILILGVVLMNRSGEWEDEEYDNEYDDW